MTSIITSHRYNCSPGINCNNLNNNNGRFKKVPFSGYPCSNFASRSGLSFFHGQQHLAPPYHHHHHHQSSWKCSPIFSSTLDGPMDSNNSEDDGTNAKDSSEGEMGKTNDERLRENLERIVGRDDSSFSGIDLATLIRSRYGRSYDVQLIKKEFMGRNLLALNVMWKYREQKSFPLTEEEYLLRLDDVANNLKCWGAVSHIRNSLANIKERPRIGKAVSIFIDMDESGGRANEWIYK